ncbi:protein GUCD1-like [Pecten maximus]|uniref:protein GUCD1-like n=1 Tax=Pecten maximus TaxID=6579 RepID=UPI001457EE79|nr:protein GUCD1-like [Pecten maximus]
MEEAVKGDGGIKLKEKDAESQRQVQLKVPTHIQSYSWDCGLACCCMVLRYMKRDDHSVYTSDFEALNCGESIWTIDLAYLFKYHDIKTKLTTITLGVDQEYAKKPFYRNHFNQDEDRVGKMFSEAASRNIDVEKCSVPMSDIVNHIAKENLVICLVDWNYLECIWCDKRRHCFSCFKRCCGTYQGHFVVVCGFDQRKKRVFYKNPSYDEEVCCSRMDKFDKARKSNGTDEDTLFIFSS